MTDLTSYATEPMCLPLDIRMLSRTIKDELTDYPDERLLWWESQARRRVKAVLRSRYPADSSLRVSSPIVSVPVQAPIYDTQIENQESYQEGVQSGLRVVVARSGIFSDQYVIEFTDGSGAYKITGHYALDQGTSKAYGSDETSTNTYLTIYADAWVGTANIKKGDKFYFTVNNYDETITHITAKLALGYAIKYDGLDIEQTFIDDAENFLKQLADVNSGVGLAGATMHLDDAPIALPGMDVDVLGRKFSDEPNDDAYGNEGEEHWSNTYNKESA